jgi:hypothetical protein
MTPGEQERTHHPRSGAVPLDRQEQQFFAGLVYIDQDGVERVVSDIPTLIARIQEGSLTGSSLVKGPASGPWRHAKVDPNLAPLLSLGGARIDTHASRSTLTLTRRVGASALKSAFLVTMFLAAVDGDRYFMSQRIRTLKEIRAKIRPERERPPLPPPPKQYAPPRATAAKRCGFR